MMRSEKPLLSVFATSKQYKLPIFCLILDNGGWSAVKESTLRVYPDGDAKAENSFEAELPMDCDFSKVGEAFGCYGEKTIETHRMQLMARLGIHDVTGLVRYALRMGLVPADK